MDKLKHNRGIHRIGHKAGLPVMPVDGSTQ